LVNGFMSRVLADRVPGPPDQAELHEAVDQRPVVPLGGDRAAGDLEHDHTGDVGVSAWVPSSSRSVSLRGNGPVLVPVILASRSATRSSAARLRGWSRRSGKVVKMTGTAASQVPVSTACGQPAG
jgi:hypothetical protein